MTRNRDMLITISIASEANAAEIAEFIADAVDVALQVHMELNPRTFKHSPNGPTVVRVDEAS